MLSCLTKEHMEKLSTKRLLAYLRKLNVEKSLSNNFINERYIYINYKKCYEDCKEVLSNREHIEKG